MKLRILDLFCGAGGASMGYHRAGFEVVGVDIALQPNYPFEFKRINAFDVELSYYDAIHASPPCQNYCWSTSKHRRKGKVYPDLIEATRDLLIASGKQYIIENVPTAPLIDPVYLEGPMFALGVIRRRAFETNWRLEQPRFRRRKSPIMQQSKKDKEVFLQKSAYCTVAGNGADGWSCRVADWRKAMGIDWMTRGEITQAIPPAYTEFIGRHLIEML